MTPYVETPYVDIKPYVNTFTASWFPNMWKSSSLMLTSRLFWHVLSLLVWWTVCCTAKSKNFENILQGTISFSLRRRWRYILRGKVQKWTEILPTMARRDITQRYARSSRICTWNIDFRYEHFSWKHYFCKFSDKTTSLVPYLIK